MRNKPILYLAGLLFFAFPALAVVVSFEATDASGKPLPTATIQIGELVALTGDDGKATIEVAAEPGEKREIVVTFGGEVVFDAMVELRADATVRLTTSAQPGSVSGDPSDIFADGFESGDPAAWKLTTVSGMYSTERIEPHLGAQSFEVVTRLNGEVVPDQSQSGSLSPSEVEDANGREDKRHEVPVAVGVKVEFPLPPIGGARRATGVAVPAANGDRRSHAERFATASAAPGSAIGRGSWQLRPYLSFGASQADVEFRSLDLEADTAATFAGDGLLLSAGIRGVILPCADCRWFGTVGYERAWTETIDMVRTPGLQASVPQGINAVEDRVSYRAESDSVRATIGRSLRRSAPWVGVRATSWRADLDIDLLLQAAGLPAEQAQSARNEYEEDLIEAIAGVDVRLSGSGLVLRVEGSTDGDNHSLLAGFGVGRRSR